MTPNHAYTADTAKKNFHSYCVHYNILIYSDDMKACKKQPLQL